MVSDMDVFASYLPFCPKAVLVGSSTWIASHLAHVIRETWSAFLQQVLVWTAPITEEVLPMVA